MPQQLTAEGTSKFVEAGGLTFHYNEAGQGHPVLLLHGGGPGATGWSNYNPNLGYLADSFRVIAIDMPGWGQSSPVKAEERDHPAHLLAFMDALGIEKAALVGNSMGGATSMSFAARFPDRISHLVTMGPPTPIHGWVGPGDGPSEGLKALYRGFQSPSLETMRDLVNLMTFDASNATDELIQQRADAALANPEHLKNWLAGTGGIRWTITADDIPKISAPTLLMHGRDDRVVSYESSLALVSLIPNSRLVIFNKCGHWAQLEHAAEFNWLVRDFILSN